MARYREVKKYGNSHVIFLTTADLKDLKLNKGDHVDIDKIKKLGKVKEETHTPHRPLQEVKENALQELAESPDRQYEETIKGASEKFSDILS